MSADWWSLECKLNFSTVFLKRCSVDPELFSNAKWINGTAKWGWRIKVSPLSVAISTSATIWETWI